MKNRSDSIAHIRSFNRFYTNVLGLLDRHLLDSGYSLTEARVLFEIGKMDYCTANTMVNQLNIDCSYMSRIIKRFELNQLVVKTQSQKDSRVNCIMLTEKGRQEVDELSQKSDAQVKKMIETLSQAELIEVMDAMEVIQNRISNAVSPIIIRNFIKSDIDYVIMRHQDLYEKEYGLSSVFRSYVEKNVHYFYEHFDDQKECMLIAELDGHPVGSIVIVKVDDKIAQLRYFLLEPETRGRGLGNKLVDMVLDFCREKGYQHIFLETISFLQAARHIYKSKGFEITQTHENPEWGKDVLEERWDLDL